MKKKIIKNLKPIEYDIHLKYQCKCSQYHWISYSEASEPDFIIVCDCKKILKVKPISKFLIKYQKIKIETIHSESNNDKNVIETVPEDIIQPTTEIESVDNAKSQDTTITEPELTQIHEVEEQPEIKEVVKSIPSNLLNTCSNLLVTFGYNKREATNIVNTFYYSNLDIDQSQFVKLLLIYIGRSNANNFASY